MAMSKKLEESYKSMMAEEVPDLWNRIEKNLPEKTPNITTAKPEGQVIEFKSIKRAPEGSIRKIERKNRWARLSGLAVACLALLIVIPVVINTKKATDDGERQRRKHNDADASQAEATKEMAAIDFYGETNGADSYLDTDDLNFDTASTETLEGPEAAIVVEEGEDSRQDNSDNKASATYSSNKQTKDAGASSSYSGETVTVIFNIVESNFDEEGEISYSAVIIDTLDSHGLTAGQNIVIYSNGGAQDNLEAGKSYTFTLKYVDTLDDGRAAYCFN